MCEGVDSQWAESEAFVAELPSDEGRRKATKRTEKSSQSGRRPKARRAQAKKQTKKTEWAGCVFSLYVAARASRGN